jgi:HK97 family phage major capsid protein/HK97 family phage prohead protease
MSDLLRRDFTAELHVREDGETPERIIEGLVVPFGVVATVADRDERGALGAPYREMIARSAVEGLDPAKVTLESSEHEGKLVGRGISATPTDEGLHMALRVSKTAAGDELLELARDGVLSSMSVVFHPISERRTTDGVVERTAIDIRRVAVLERGAYQAAQITAVRADPEPTPPPAAAPAPDSRSTKVETKEYTSPEDRAARIHELEESLTRQATEFPGVMPVEAQARFEADRIELDKHRADAAAWNERQTFLATLARRDAVDKAPAIISRPAEADIYDTDSIRRMSRTREEYNSKVRDNALRAVETIRFPDIADQAAVRNRMADLIEVHDSRDKEIANRVLTTGSPVYKRAWGRYVSFQTPTPEEQHALERAAMAVGVDATGGFAIPFAFDPDFIRTGAWTSTSPYRQACRVETIVGTDTWRAVSTNAVGWVYATESAATVEGAPTLAQPEVIVKRAQGFATLSYETLQDRSDIGSELAKLFAEAKDTYEENQFTLGVGTTVFPAGMFLLSQFTTTKTATAATTVIADLDLLEAALPIRHRAKGAFFMSRAAIRAFQTQETAGGKYFQSTLGYPAVGGIQPGGNTGKTLLGYPLWETPSASWTPTTPDTNPVVFCDPANYIIVDRLGMSVELVPNLFDASTGFPTGQRGVMAFARNSAKALYADGGRTLVVE